MFCGVGSHQQLLLVDLTMGELFSYPLDLNHSQKSLESLFSASVDAPFRASYPSQYLKQKLTMHPSQGVEICDRFWMDRRDGQERLASQDAPG
jgi:hypothetical protein